MNINNMNMSNMNMNNMNMSNMNMNMNKPIDILSLIHLIIWVVIGSCFPNYYLYALLFSILFELFEYMLVKVNIFYVLMKKYWFIPEKYWNETIYNKIIDIIINMIGYCIGSYISSYILRNI